MADYNDKVVNAELILPEGDGGNIVGDDGQFHTEDTTTVTMLGNGTSTTPLKATVIVDPASGNALVAGVDGLSVGISPLSDNLLVLAGGKLYVAPPQIVVPISSKSGNTLVEVTDPGEEGLYVPPGEKGDKGDKGDQGDPGIGIYIQGVLPDPSQLPPASTMQEGDTYVIGTHYWTVTGGQWVDLGDFAGPQGQDGIGLIIKGSFTDTSFLPTEGNTEGDTYIIQDQMWVWTGDASGWQPVGQVGPQGPKGDTGEQGPQGIQGPKGDPGNDATALSIKGEVNSSSELPATGNTTGDAYFVGNDIYAWLNNGWVNKGPIAGPQGPQGPTGPQGIQGPAGPKGDTGATGLTGPVGPQGPQGPKGDRGETGYSARILGTKSSVGDLPAQGTPGDAWIIIPDLYVWSDSDAQWMNVGPYVGPKGDKGDTGDTGPAGPKGDTGADGAQGPKGDTGATGPAGADGAQGPEGPMGVALTPKGTVANEAALPSGASHGDYYTTDDTGEGFAFDGSNWINLGVQRGPQGDTGPQGLQGDVGPQGPQGDVGPAGPTGPQGPKGDQGAGIKPLGTKASEADLPATGTEGDGWIIGSDLWVWSVTDNDWINVGGFVGPTGPAGPTGPEGPQGSQGIQGVKGDQGTLWLNFSRNPSPADGRVGDYFINKSTLEYFQKTSATVWASLGYMGGGNVYDTSSTTPQARTSSGWVNVPVLEAPTDSGYYVRVNSAWKKLDRYDLLVTSSTGAMDVNVSQVFKVDGTANKTMSFTNLPPNRAMTIVIVFSGSGASLTWPGTLAWSNGTAVTLGTTRTVVTILWDGTNLTGTTSLTVN